MRLHIGPEILIGRLRPVILLRDQFEFLADPALDDGVVLVEAERHALAVENFVTDIDVDERLELGLRRRAAPGRLVLAYQGVHLSLADDDAPGVALPRRRLAEQQEQQEQRQPDQQEMQKGLAQYATKSLAAPRWNSDV